jgi:hypothetical protein
MEPVTVRTPPKKSRRNGVYLLDLLIHGIKEFPVVLGMLDFI